MLVDCHTHVEQYPDDEIAEVLDRAADAGVGIVVSAGTTLESSERSVELSTRFPQLYAGVGLHPTDLTGRVDQKTYDRLAELAMGETVLMVSEIGLDFQERSPDRAVQYQAFRQQIGLARELRKPIVFHSREAHADSLRVLREERAYEVGGAMHYFQADMETAQRAIELGFLISLARPLLRLPHLQEVAAALPLESIVLESDAAPQPFKPRRENWTEPRHVSAVAAKLAELQGRPEAEVERVTTENFLSLVRHGHEGGGAGEFEHQNPP